MCVCASFVGSLWVREGPDCLRSLDTAARCRAVCDRVSRVVLTVEPPRGVPAAADQRQTPSSKVIDDRRVELDAYWKRRASSRIHQCCTTLFSSYSTGDSVGSLQNPHEHGGGHIRNRTNIEGVTTKPARTQTGSLPYSHTHTRGHFRVRTVIEGVTCVARRAAHTHGGGHLRKSTVNASLQ